MINNKKFKKLVRILRGMKRVLIAYSGGVDSTFLLKVARDTLGRENALAVVARSETFPGKELKSAKDTAKKLDARYIVINTKELELKAFKANPVNRCYYCKRELFGKLQKMARRGGFKYVLDGSNRDDLKDMRFGRKAAEELGVKSPLVEAGITKKEIRDFSKRLRLSTWAKPSLACLSSRVPYGSPITGKKLVMIDKAEDILRELGFTQVRVRIHQKTARIELYKEQMGKLLDRAISGKVVNRLKKLGFDYVTVDLAGYRTGSMNEPHLKSS